MGNLARKNYKELSVAFADSLKAPKHPLKSQLGQKALKDLDAWAKYDSSSWHSYSNSPVEKEALDEENKIRGLYRRYQEGQTKA